MFDATIQARLLDISFVNREFAVKKQAFFSLELEDRLLNKVTCAQQDLWIKFTSHYNKQVGSTHAL